MSLPRIELMQPTLLARPFHREGWVFEEKIDGWRMLAFKEGDHVRLVSRQGRDHTKRFPDLVKSIRALAPETLILDGEVAIFDERLISRFAWMGHGKKPSGVATPPMSSTNVRGQLWLGTRPSTNRCKSTPAADSHSDYG